MKILAPSLICVLNYATHTYTEHVLYSGCRVDFRIGVLGPPGSPTDTVLEGLYIESAIRAFYTIVWYKLVFRPVRFSVNEGLLFSVVYVYSVRPFVQEQYC